MDHLKRNDFKESRAWVTVRLREEYDAEDLIKTVKNVRIRLWKIQELTVEQPELDIPNMEKEIKEEEIPF